ncbi:MAG TPA: serine protease [Pirellulaceae bacterium]
MFLRLVLVLGMLSTWLGGSDRLWSQVASESPLWQWTQLARHHESIVRVGLDGAEGTGIVFHVDRGRPSADGYLGHCLTAYHVVQKDQGRGAIKVDYRNGRHAHRGRIVAFDEANDVAIVWVWVPADLEPAKIAERPVKPGEGLEVAGLGGRAGLQCCLRHFSATAAVSTSSDRIYADIALLPGDSGGPVFNSDKEVAGIVSGGWFWFNPRDTHSDMNLAAESTWPARACNVNPIRKLLQSSINCAGEGCDVKLADLTHSTPR